MTQQRRLFLAAVAVLAIVAGIGAMLVLNGRAAQDEAPAVIETVEPAPAVIVAGATLRPARKPLCADPADGPFTPTSLTIPGVTTKATVLALGRDGHNVPSTPPVSGSGKYQVAWDRPPGVMPGSAKGNVLLNMHTWPDGTALGNAMLANLHEGDRIKIAGEDDSLCYRVTKRIEVRASEGYPPYYDTEGPPQLAIVVCSGRRLGPGDWTHRTLWFASPISS